MHECRADGGKAHCDCKVGYILADDKKTCEGKCSSNSNRVNRVLSGKTI